MKVCYLIFSSDPNSGGGHFHSLRTIVSALSNAIEYRVFNAGLTLGKPLRGFQNAKFLPLRRRSIFQNIRSLYQHVRNFQPDVIHAFDFKSLWLGRLIGYWLDKPVVFTKCGGANGSAFIPSADAYTLFSGENLEHYKKYKKSGGALHLIPNRAENGSQDHDRIASLKEHLQLSDEYVILRISRVTSYYHRTYKQAFELLKRSLEGGKKAVLILLGFVQDEDFYMILQSEAENLPVFFVTDPLYCRNASELVSIADAVVATGRGVMEAAANGVQVYAPVQNRSMPVALSKETLPSLLYYNFSERSTGDVATAPYVETAPRKVETLEIFEEYFSVVSAAPKYLKIYEETTSLESDPVNFFMHGLRFFKGTR